MEWRSGNQLALFFLLLVGLVLAFSGVSIAGTVYSQGFESAVIPALPAGCSDVDVSGTTGQWATSTGTVHPGGTSPHGGSKLAYFNSYTASLGDSSRLVLEGPFDLDGYAQVTASLWMYHETGWNNADRVQFQVSTDGGASWQNVGSPILRNDGSTGWKKESVDLSAFAGNASVRVGILGVSQYGNDVHIDDVSIETALAPATTPFPGNESVDVTVDPTLSWAHSGDVSFDLFFGTESGDLPLMAGGLSEKTYPVSGLENATTYYWRVDAKSGDLAVSGDVWSFTTEEGGSVIPDGESSGECGIPDGGSSGGCNAAGVALIGLAMLAPLGLLRRKPR